MWMNNEYSTSDINQLTEKTMANAKYIFSEMQNKYTVNRVTAVQVRWVRLSLAKFVQYERAFIISSSIVPLSPPIRRYPFLSHHLWLFGTARDGDVGRRQKAVYIHSSFIGSSRFHKDGGDAETLLSSRLKTGISGEECDILTAAAECPNSNYRLSLITGNW